MVAGTNVESNSVVNYAFAVKHETVYQYAKRAEKGREGERKTDELDAERRKRDNGVTQGRNGRRLGTTESSKSLNAK